MKATELMIGDWCKMKLSFGTTWFTDKVGCISPDNGMEYEPIPLTPEILEKNGFEFVSVSTIAISSTKLLDIHTSIHFQFINGKSAFVRLHHCGAGSYEFSKHIQSVHELQHALRLCGLNELADNFKV